MKFLRNLYNRIDNKIFALCNTIKCKKCGKRRMKKVTSYCPYCTTISLKNGNTINLHNYIHENFDDLSKEIESNIIRGHVHYYEFANVEDFKDGE